MQKCSSSCATCSSFSICLLEGNMCEKQCYDNCLTGKETINQCDSCRGQYILNGTSCILCSEGCQMCEINDNKTICLRILDGYYKECIIVLNVHFHAQHVSTVIHIMDVIHAKIDITRVKYIHILFLMEADAENAAIKLNYV